MPSGFQQDYNQLTPSYYRVTIECNDDATYWFEQGDSPGPNFEGRVSALGWDNFTNNDRPNTQSRADALARGNLRFQAVVEALSGLADCQILDIEHNNSASNMHDNQHIYFTVKFDRDEGVFPAYCAIRKAEGANTDGTTSYDGQTYPQYYLYCDNGDTANNPQDAIRDTIWHALSQDHTRSVRVFHPVEGTDPLEGAGYQDVITAEAPWANGQDAYNDISVTEINGTTTTITYD